MQKNRLFQIIYHLLTHKHTTAEELSEKLEVSVRTIYRDLDALSSANIPIYTETGRNGGIFLMDHFVLEQAVFSEEEQQELLSIMQEYSTTQNNTILEKLSAIFHTKYEDWLDIDLSNWGSKKTIECIFKTLKQAIFQQLCIIITYAGSNGATKQRTIHPYQLCFRSKDWYVHAYCTSAKEMRYFKLKRILEISETNETFTRQVISKEKPMQQRDYPEIILRFSKEVAYRIYDEFDISQITKMEDGSYQVKANMPIDSWFIGYLLSFSTAVEVIQPLSVKEAVKQQVQAIYDQYYRS